MTLEKWWKHFAVSSKKRSHLFSVGQNLKLKKGKNYHDSLDNWSLFAASFPANTNQVVHLVTFWGKWEYTELTNEH